MASTSMDLELEAEQVPTMRPRGWSMKHGHRKRLGCLGRQGFGEVEIWSRAIVKRTVNDGSRKDGYGLWEKKNKNLRQWRGVWDDMMDGVLELESDEMWAEWWEVSDDETAAWETALEMADQDFDDCSSIADLSTTASSCDCPRKASPTAWENAQKQAEVAAKEYRDAPAKAAESSRRREKALRDPEMQRLAQSLEAHRVKLRCPELALRQQDAFEAFRMSFLQKFAESISRGLQSCYMMDVELRAAPMNKSLQSRFLSCKDKQADSLCPVLHGTDEKNLSSIYQKGLLVPATNNDVKVLHGSSHGRGIYTAKTNNTALSFGFSKGLSRPLLVCAALDDALPLATPVLCGNHYITAESAQVRHVGDAIVVFDESKVLPLFVASYPASHIPKMVPPPAVPVPIRAPVTTVPAQVPLEEKRRDGPRTRLKTSSKISVTRLQQAVAYLSRRGACKRRP